MDRYLESFDNVSFFLFLSLLLFVDSVPFVPDASGRLSTVARPSHPPPRNRGFTLENLQTGLLTVVQLRDHNFFLILFVLCSIAIRSPSGRGAVIQ